MSIEPRTTKGECAMKHLPCIFAIVMATASVAGDENGEKPKSDKDLIQGTWQVVSGTEGGQVRDPKGLRILVTADMLVFQPKDAKSAKDTLRMTYKLDPTKNPKQIDTSHRLSPTEKPFIQLGIYSLAGDSLTLCLAAAGKPRPTKLESREGDSSVSFILKRVKAEGK